jgi:hypothetical protein
MVMRAMGTSVQRTIDDGHPEVGAHGEALDRGRMDCACGVLGDGFKCREQTNRFLAHCCPAPINHAPLATL